MKRTKNVAKALQHVLIINLPVIFVSALLMVALAHADGHGEDNYGYSVENDVTLSNGVIYVVDKVIVAN